MAKFQIFKSLWNNQYYFRLRATGNNEIILSSEGYKSLDGCKRGINSIKVNAQYDFNYNKLYSTNQQYYFTLKAGNGEPIGVSETYKTSTARDAGISLVKQQAPIAVVEDLSQLR